MIAIKTFLWSIFVPGTVTLVVPYLLLSSRANHFDFQFSYLRLLGLLPIVAGVLLYVWCAWDFTFTGQGTPAPFDPPKELVVKGPYRYVRNPMYTGILMIGFSLGLALGTWLLPASATLVFSILAVRTRTEETYLIARFGDQYRAYMSRVGRFFPI